MKFYRMKPIEEDLPISGFKIERELGNDITLSSNYDLTSESLRMAKKEYNKDRSIKCIHLNAVNAAISVHELEHFIIAAQSMIKYIKGEA